MKQKRIFETLLQPLHVPEEHFMGRNNTGLKRRSRGTLCALVTKMGKAE